LPTETSSLLTVFGLPELIGDERLVKKVRFGKEMRVRDLSSQPLPVFEKGEWLKIITITIS